MFISQQSIGQLIGIMNIKCSFHNNIFYKYS